MKKRENFAKKLIVGAMAAAMAFGAVEGAGMVTSPARADQEDAGSFDPVYYAALYPDVAAVVGTRPEALYSHYVMFGQKEGRIPYEGAAGGESVDGTGAASENTGTETAPTDNIGNGPFYLLDGQEVDRATFLLRKQELQQQFDSAGYVHVGWTEQQVKERLITVREKYPDGMKVGDCNTGAAKIRNELYGKASDFCVGSNGDGEWIHVDGFVPQIITGTHNAPLKEFVRVGDEVCTRGTRVGHVFFVTARDDSGITVVESNFGPNHTMHWGRRISWEELENGGSDQWTVIHRFMY